MKWMQAGGILAACLYTVGGLYHLVLSPPLHLLYERSPPAGPSSVYVPGSGFSGFWYHLGLFQGLDQELTSYNYYCYSSGCLSLVLAFLNTTIDETVDACYEIQNGWMQGELSRFDMVNHFLNRLVTPTDVNRIEHVLHQLNIIVTTASRGVEIVQPSNRSDLIDLLIKTTWIPIVTGQGVALEQDGERYLDGGFSRVLHPPCNHSVWVPTTWTTFVHSLNPGLGREAVYQLFEMGKSADHPLLVDAGRR
ncbi:hypothetical protein MPSEU_000358000 [Mayamaea pseudoterrestris]|nr:hypothetical protein MPSEU_000358000 [Mayamaea pseudoterrestris]